MSALEGLRSLLLAGTKFSDFTKSFNWRVLVLAFPKPCNTNWRALFLAIMMSSLNSLKLVPANNSNSMVFRENKFRV